MEISVELFKTNTCGSETWCAPTRLRGPFIVNILIETSDQDSLLHTWWAPPQSWFRRVAHIFARCLLMCSEDLEQSRDQTWRFNYRYYSKGNDERLWTFGEDIQVPNVIMSMAISSAPQKNGLIWYSTSILGSWNSHWPFETFGHWGPELSITRGHVGPVAQGWTVEQPEICAARSFHTGRIGGAGEQHWMVMFGWSKQCGAVLIYTGSIHVNTHCINSYGTLWNHQIYCSDSPELPWIGWGN